MAESSESSTEGVSQKTEKELVKLFKRRLENWREILTHLNALITWEKPYYPGIIAGFVTFVFLVLWYFDPSVLTALSILGIFVCIFDYIVPIISASVFDSSKWTGFQEKKYEEICHGFVDTYLKLKHSYESVHHVKESKPYLYFVGVLGVLLFTAWIGNLIDNLFLTYLTVLVASLIPGIKSHQVVQEHLSQITAMVRGMCGQSKKKK